MTNCSEFSILAMEIEISYRFLLFIHMKKISFLIFKIVSEAKMGYVIFSFYICLISVALFQTVFNEKGTFFQVGRGLITFYFPQSLLVLAIKILCFSRKR